jgi:hypothetical protein
MRPHYMGRVMKTYPISEPELENISTLDSQVTVRFAVGSALLTFAIGIWTNALFAKEMTAQGQLAVEFVAPLLLVFAIGFAVAGLVSRQHRKSVWDRIKRDSLPVTTVAQAGGLIVSGSRQD